MTIDQLNYFCAIAKYKNITRAADALYISQPTLSRQIVQLEQEFGCQLIIRDNHGATLTDVGKVFLTHAEEILKKIDYMRVDVRNAHENLTGHLRIASINVYYPTLNNLYRQYNDIYPGVQFALMKYDDHAVMHAVLNKTADVGLTFSFNLPDDPSQLGLNYMPIYNEEFVAVMSDQNKLAKYDKLSLSHLHSDQHVLFLGQLQIPFIQALWSKAGLTHRFNAEVRRPDSIESILLQIGADNKSISLVPRPILSLVPEGYKYSKIDDLDSSFHVVMLWRADDKSNAVCTFLDLIRNQYMSGSQ